MLHYRMLLALAAITTGASPVNVQAAAANLGTLICTVSPGTSEPLGDERKLSCNFEPVSGVKASFSGIVKRMGAVAPGQRKIVLAWSVVGPADASAEQLEGRYVGSLEQQRATAAGLVGGKNGDIRLQPLAVAPDVGENAAVAIIDLELSGMRA